MIEPKKESNNSSFDSIGNDSFLSNSEQNDDISYSYNNNKSFIESLLDSEENTNFNDFNDLNNKENINQNITNIPNNINLNNGFNNFNYNQLQQLYYIYYYNQYYNQCLFLNKQIQENKLMQMLINILNNNKIQKNNENQKKNQKKNKKNVEKKEIKKIPPKIENEIKIPLLLSGEEKRTLVKLSPIPNKYSPFDIIRLIDRYLKTKKGQRIYNSLYVPLAKVIGSNKGYCFINLVSPKYVVEFFKIFNGLVFNIKNCKKPCTVVFSDNQSVDCSNEDALKRPIIFTDVINN